LNPTLASHLEAADIFTLAQLVAEQRQKQAEKQDVAVMQDHRAAPGPRAVEPAVVS
jgi:hypothetical protein